MILLRLMLLTIFVFGCGFLIYGLQHVFAQAKCIECGRPKWTIRKLVVVWNVDVPLWVCPQCEQKWMTVHQEIKAKRKIR